jgi:protein ImuB
VFRERLAPQPGGATQKDATQKDATQKGAMTAAQPHRWFLHGIFG